MDICLQPHGNKKPHIADRQSAYRQLFRSAIAPSDLQKIRDSTHKGWVLGSERFKQQMELGASEQVWAN